MQHTVPESKGNTHILFCLGMAYQNNWPSPEQMDALICFEMGFLIYCPVYWLNLCVSLTQKSSERKKPRLRKHLLQVLPGGIFLPPGSCPVWAPVLTAFSYEQQCGSISPNNFFPPQLARWSQRFIVTIETLTQRPGWSWTPGFHGSSCFCLGWSNMRMSCLCFFSVMFSHSHAWILNSKSYA